MFGVILLLVAAIFSGWAALQTPEYPEWPRQLLSFIAVLDVVAVGVVLLRQIWSRRAAMILLGAQVLVVDLVLIVAAAIIIRDNPAQLGGTITLTLLLFVPGALVDTVITLLAAISINKLAWPDR